MLSSATDSEDGFSSLWSLMKMRSGVEFKKDACETAACEQNEKQSIRSGTCDSRGMQCGASAFLYGQSYEGMISAVSTPIEPINRSF